jgi:ferritin-like metal-binding protein YciE
MHQTTYQRLAQEYEIARYNSVIEFAGRMGMLAGEALELA